MPDSREPDTRESTVFDSRFRTHQKITLKQLRSAKVILGRAMLEVPENYADTIAVCIQLQNSVQ